MLKIRLQKHRKKEKKFDFAILNVLASASIAICPQFSSKTATYTTLICTYHGQIEAVCSPLIELAKVSQVRQ